MIVMGNNDVSDMAILMRLKRELNDAAIQLARLQLESHRRKLLSEHWEVRFKGQAIYSFTSSKSAHDKRRSLVRYETGGYSVVRVRRFSLCRSMCR